MINTGSQEQIRQRIISEYQSGIDIPDLSVKYDRHEKSIARMLRVYRKRRTFRRKRGSGRPNVLTKQDKLRLVGIVNQNPFVTLRQLRDRLNTVATTATIGNYLKSLNYVHKKLKKKITLTAEDVQSRFTFAERNRNRDWSNVIFVDEAGVWLFKESPYGWVKRGQDKYFYTESHPSKVNVFAAIDYEGKLNLTTYRQNLNSELYCHILENNLIPSIDQDDWILVHDNHPTHNSLMTQAFIEENNIEQLEWPINAQDIHPSENIWPHLKRKALERNPQNIDQLEDYIHEAWNELENELIYNVFDSIYQRIEDLIRLGGRSLSY